MPQYTCTRDQYNRDCNYIFIVYRYIEQFKANSEWKTESMQATVKEDSKINITRNVAWKARRYVVMPWPSDRSVEMTLRSMWIIVTHWIRI